MKLVKRTFSEIRVGDVVTNDTKGCPNLRQKVVGVAQFPNHILVRFGGWPYLVRFDGLLTCVVSEEVSEKGE